MRLLTAVVLAGAIALAGCTGADDHSHGEAFACDDGTIINPGNFTSHHNESFDPASECPAPAEEPLPATVRIEGLPGASLAYSPVSFRWVLQTDEANAHAMLTEVRANRVSIADDLLEGPETFGVSLAKKEHQNFEDGTGYDGEWRPTEPGTYFLRAYAEVFGRHVWSAEHAVVVDPVEATGNTVTVTISAGGPLLAATEPTDAEAVLGDALVFQNDDLADHTFAWTAGPVDLPAFTVAGGAATEPLLLLVPGTYTYESDDLQPVTGTVTVAPPASS